VNHRGHNLEVQVPLRNFGVIATQVLGVRDPILA
jgi:hypothetical protein